MPLTNTAASAATHLHVPPSGNVTRQLAARALKLAAVLAEDDAHQASLDELRSLQSNACFHPSGNAVGAAFQLSIMLMIVEGLPDCEEVRALEYLARHVLDYVGSGEPFAGYFYGRAM